MLKISQNRHFARALNQYLGTPAPKLPTVENQFAGGNGCRWCEGTNRWVVVLPIDATQKLDLIENSFKVHGLTTFRLPIGDGASVELSAYARGEGLRLQ